MVSSVEYSTQNADYRQVYTVHTMPIKDSVFEKGNFDSVDAVVLEAYHSEEWFDMLWKSEYKKFHDAVLKNVQRTGKPVYVTDVMTTPGGRSFEDVATLLPDFFGLIGVVDGVSKVRNQRKEMTRRKFLKFFGAQTTKVIGGAYLVGSDMVYGNYVMLTGETPEFLARLNSSRTHLIPTSQSELRNAISARKIEEFIVPELQQKLGRNPKVLLVYGAGHSGLREDLQRPKLRDFYIRLYSTMGFPGIDTTYLDTITNLSIDQNGQYSLRHRKANLL